jgi:hypothetical protein
MRGQAPSNTHLVFGFAVVLLFLVAAYLIMAPNFVRSGSTKSNGILNNLRILDTAKEEWAVEHHQTGSVFVTKEDVAPYLGRVHGDFLEKPIAGERYILGTLTERPEAELAHELDGRPKGTILRLGTNLADSYVLPKKMQ